MFMFEPTAYGPKVTKLLSEDRLNELGPGSPNKNTRGLLDALRPDEMLPSISNREMAACCLSGLWLWHDFLDQSHEVCQEISLQSGSYWHGIMHRREPDYSNAKYWFRRVGDHEIFLELQDLACALADNYKVHGDAAQLANQSNWDPYAFVDLCASVAPGQSDAEMYCRELARCEWQLLFDHCFQNA